MKEAYSDFKNGVYEKRLVCEDQEAIFIFNNSEEDRVWEIENDILYVGGFGSADGKTFKVPANSMAYIIVKR